MALLYLSNPNKILILGVSMWPYMLIGSVISGHLITRLAESRMHHKNRPFMLHSGGEELDTKNHKGFYLWYTAAIFLASIEYVVRGFPEGSLQGAGVFLVITSLGLRIWAIQSIGRMWTKFSMYIYGVPMVTSGPYKWMKHPEYISRYAELLGLMLIFSSFASVTVSIVMMTIYLSRIIPAEGRQLNLLAYQNLRPPHTQPSID